MCIPKAPKIAAPPPPPTLPQAPSEVDPSIAAARNRARRSAAAQSGFQSTILTSPRGVTTSASTAEPELGGSRAASAASKVSTSTPGAQPTSVQVDTPVAGQPSNNQDFIDFVRARIGRGPLGKKGGAARIFAGGSGTISGGGGGGTSFVTGGGGGGGGSGGGGLRRFIA